MGSTSPTLRGPLAAVGPLPLPPARGPLTGRLFRLLSGLEDDLGEPPQIAADQWASDDLQLALYVCYELHYRSFAGVDDRWEWYPPLLAWRRSLEASFEDGLLSLVDRPLFSGDVAEELRVIATSGRGPSLSSYMAEQGTIDEMREFAVHRSAYQLKEADPHTWAIPRLSGEPKAALVEIQSDEYGGGVTADMHSSLFAVTMAELGLDPRSHAYLDWLPAATLATVNLVSLFGLQRRWRGALVGHLALFEMTSVGPMQRYSRALARLGVGAAGRRFYDVHVEADAGHELVAAHRMAGRLALDEPALASDVLFGARALMAVEERFARHLLDAWSAGTSSLCRPLVSRDEG